MAECAYTIRVPMNFRIAAVMLVALLYASARVLTQQTIQPYLWQAGMARSDVGEITCSGAFQRNAAARSTRSIQTCLRSPFCQPPRPAAGR